MDVFRILAATGERFRAVVANETDDAGVVDRRREIVRERARRANETRRG